MLSACASNPDGMTASYISTMQYEDYSCKQLAREAATVQRKVSELHGTLDKKASNDALQMGVGLVLLWPTLFFLEGGDGPDAAEYKRLKGEYEAIEKVSNLKDCGLDFVKSDPVSETSEQTSNSKSYN